MRLGNGSYFLFREIYKDYYEKQLVYWKNTTSV